MHARVKKNKTGPFFVFPVVALLPGPTRGAGRMGWVGWVGGGGERTGQPSPDSALLCSLGNRPVCVCLPRLKCHEAARPFDPTFMSPQYVSLSGSRAPLHIPTYWGEGGRGGRNVTKTVLGEHFELRPRALHASDGGERAGNGSQTQQCGACEPAEEINLTTREKTKRK